MARAKNLLSKRNRNATFTGAQVRSFVETLGASKRARIVRERAEFDPRDLQSILRPPIIPPAAYAWTIEQIVDARNEQLTGRFRLPARLAESMGTDDALFTARGVRLAPVQSLDVEITAAPGGKSDKIADEASALFGMKGISVSPETITTIRQHLTDHGVAFASISWNARGDGSRIDPVLCAWPIEFVWWNALTNCYYTQVRHLAEDPDPQPGSSLYLPPSYAGLQPLEPIIHGDGRWVVFAKSEQLPHRLDAAILPGALVWARHAFAMRDWAKGSSTHGNAKVVGELPPETPLTDSAGALTAEAAAFLALVQAVASQDQPVGIRPALSKIDYITNNSHAWEVWTNLAESAEKAAARIYLGTDGVLGAQGGAPGIDISALFGVATSKIQSDLSCIERCLQSGMISPWTAMNFGDDKLAPTRKYIYPDADEDQTRDSFAKRNAAFLAAIKAGKDAGLAVTQEWIGVLAEKYGVPAPTLSIATPTPSPAPPPANDVAPPPSAPAPAPSPPASDPIPAAPAAE